MERKRILWLDYARSFAIICVVFIHSVERIYVEYDAHEIANLAASSLWFRNIAFAIGRLGVPLFLAISGYLLLDRDYSSADKIFKFYKHNLLPIVITTEIWNVIYDAIIFIDNGKFDFEVLIRDLLFFKTNQMGNMWYMPMIIGVYIALPFVANTIKNIETKALALPFTILIASVFLIGLYKQLRNIYDWEFEISSVIDISFLGGNYGIYLLFGLLCKRGEFKKIPSALLWLLSAAGVAVSALVLTNTAEIEKPIRLWYDFPGVLLASCSLFLLLSRINCGTKTAVKLAPLATAISVSSFGSFFIHKVVLYYLANPFDKIHTFNPLKALVLFAVTFIISSAVSYLFYKIPKFNRLIMAAK